MNALSIFRPKPDLGVLERDYRESFLEMDIEIAKLGIWIGIASTIALSYIDFMFYQSTDEFYGLLFLRAIFVIFSLAVIFGIQKLRTVAFYDGMLFVWWLSIFSIIVLVDISRPPSYVQNQLLYVLGAFACYTVIPLPRLVRSIPALMLSISALLVLHYLKNPLPAASLQITIASHVIMNIMGMLISARMYAFRRRQYLAQKHEAEAVRQLEVLASTDSLTGLFNRRRFMEITNIEQYRFQRSKKEFTILMMDFDHFKEINDNFGHQSGDAVLQQFAQLVLAQKRYQDCAGRLGGEEFGLLLPETALEGGIAFADRLRIGCAELNISGLQNLPAITISIGIATSKIGETSLDAFMKRADEALYRAKHLGRNRYEISY
jgi:diguanylate cyclase (GGDEF)-like protein